ncbi:carbohydrate-binding protein [uncultured Aquimarina sp.]|uniref:carbohydrate-binding protein n=1 Tax=uncultured Aquimarina sp. TaxID=575652 RepID=UPI00260E1FAA|nr:carbohydrate-binding protein [uncultured Aquimarina sp.]
MKKLKLKNLILMVFISLGIPSSLIAQFTGLIPENTATHIATKNGNWTDSSIWNSGSVPGLSSIVVIPSGRTVNYNGNSDAHVFAIRNDGTIEFKAPNGVKRKLTVDTFVNSLGSSLLMNAEKTSDGTIEIILKPFDIEGKKRGSIAGVNWNNAAKSHYSDNASVSNHFGQRLPSDGPGVLGRYGWDPAQVSLCLMARGKTRILGQDKTDFVKTSNNATKNSNRVSLASAPNGWKAGDNVMITGTESITQSEIIKLRSINGSQLTLDKNLGNDHKGYNNRKLFPYVANMTRNITVRSAEKNVITRRGHSMFMLSPDVVIKNTAFVELGRTDKSNIIDDFKFGLRYKGNGNQTDVDLTGLDYTPAQPKNIENQRGRYGLHFHKTFTDGNGLVIAQGNVVWGSPGWGMVHHDSNANFIDNVVYGVFGGGMIAESGSETGVWRNNLVAGTLKSSSSPLRNGMTAPIKRTVRKKVDDDFKTGSAYGLQSRAVRMVDNVAASSTIAYSYQASGQEVPVADKVRASAFPFDMFPLQDKVQRDVPALIEFKGNESAACRNSFKSLGREEGSHRVQSMIEDLVGWNNTQFTVYVATNFAYTFKNCYFHGQPGARNVAASLVQINDDNIVYSDVTFDNYKKLGINGAQENFDPKARFLFHNITWLNSVANPYAKLSANFRTIISDSDLRNGPMRFTPNNKMDTNINVNSGDYKVVVDGVIKDSAGDNEFGHFSRNNPGNLQRVYDFKNRAALDKYLNKYGTFTDARGTYTELTEYMSDRITGKVTPFKFRIDLAGINGSGSGLENRFSIPGLIQVENFTSQNGIKVENTSDTGGGENIGFIENNDFVEYLVDVEKTGDYVCNVRVASARSGGDIEVVHKNVTVANMKVNNTGGWQSWRTVTKTLRLTAGQNKIRLNFSGGNGFLFNVNWIEFQDANRNFSSLEKDPKQLYLKIQSNPVENGILKIEQQGHSILKIVNASGIVVKEIVNLEEFQSIDISQFSAGIYFIKAGNETQKILKM